jgi:hypothetical protein
MKGQGYKWGLVLILLATIGAGVTACAPTPSQAPDPPTAVPPALAPPTTVPPALAPTPAPILVSGPTPLLFSRVDDYETQYTELLTYIGMQQLPRSVAPASLANHAKVSQYSPDITRKYGLNACGLVAAADSYENSSEVMGWIRQAAAEAYANDAGIQPIPYTKALQAVFSQDDVRSEDQWMLGEMYPVLSSNDIVIVDIKVKQGAEIPSADRPNDSHFARVLGMDLDNERIYLENTLKGGPYWDISLREFWETWKYPETTVSLKSRGAEAVTRWAVTIRQGAVPHSPVPIP